MVNERFQPYVGRRKQYRSWLRNPNPEPPRATADRIRERQFELNRRNDIAVNPQGEGEGGANSEEDDLNENNDALGHQCHNPESSSSENLSSANGEVTVTSSNDSSGDSEEVSSDDENENNDGIPFDGGPRKQQDLEDNIFPGINCTKFECLLMILNFSFRHGLTQVATRDLCLLINTMLNGNYLPFSKHMFQKIFGNSAYQYHFYCKNCDAYLGFRHNQDRRAGIFVCEVCAEVGTVRDLNNGNFFITFPLKEQLQHLLQNTDNVLDLLQYRIRRNREEGHISDIYDGQIYSSLADEGKFLSNLKNVSLTFSTDGAQVYDSCKNTLWPLLIRINELPPTMRFEFSYSMVGGIWFGKSEPSMSLFLKTFVREITDLFENGFMWCSPNGEMHRTKCILLNCVADSKAKPLVQCVKMHSGFWGCGYCLHPGKTYDGSSQAKYPVNDDLLQLQDCSYSYTVTAVDPLDKETERRFAVEDRTNEQIRVDMIVAERARNERGEGDERGVRGQSVLYCLPYFDLVYGFVVDYMHSVLLGVTRHVTGLWLNSTSSDELYYIGRRISDVDERLLKIKPPISISRRPRSLSDRCHWKANEWRSWLLYYSLPCLKGILPSRYLQHHCLLVSAIHLLLQDKISRQDLLDASHFLGIYCVQFSVLYSEDLVFFNVHLLLHLGKCVKLWGPLFCYSSFSFESANGRLVELVKGSRGVLSQIANKYTKCKMVPKLIKMYHVSDKTLGYCDQLSCYRANQNAMKLHDVTVLGSSSYVPFQEGELRALQDSGHEVTNQSFERMIVRRSLYHARCYRRKGEKSDSSIVKLKCGFYGTLTRIIDPINYRGPGEPRPILVLKQINVERDPVTYHQSGAKASHIKMCSMIVYGDYKVVTTDEVACSAILMNCVNRSYVAVFPNMYEKD